MIIETNSITTSSEITINDSNLKFQALTSVTQATTSTMVNDYTAEFDKNKVNSSRHTVKKRKVLRRLRGFIYEMDSNNVTVIFIDKDKEYRYSFAKRILIQNGISEKNQPFEMDEVEIEDENGLAIMTEFRPMADAKSSNVTPFNMSASEQKSLNTVLKHNYAEI